MIKILLPVDGSQTSLEAVRHALHLAAEGLDAVFVLANVQEPATLYEMVTARDEEVLERVSEGAGEHLLEPAEALLAAAGARWEREIGHGDPASLLLELAENHQCDAIVLGAQGRGESSALFGSVSQWLLHHASMPVTVVRSAERAPAEAEPESGFDDAAAEAGG